MARRGIYPALPPEKHYSGLPEQYAALATKFVALTAERDRYKAALEKYGRHRTACTHGAAREIGKPCTCGFDDFLSPATSPDTKGE